MSRILVTGAAGFIGMHTARALLDRGDQVVGIDNLNDYYDPTLKHPVSMAVTRSFHFPRPMPLITRSVFTRPQKNRMN